MNLETIQTVILQNQKILSRVEGLVARDLEIQAIPHKASVLIGIRRAGKSTYIRKFIADTVRDKELVCWLDFADDRLIALQSEEPGQIADAYYQLYPENHDRTVVFFFDEIQLVNNWALFVNRIQNTENCQVFITGSSAKMLSTELATELAGRTLSWDLFPYSFKEYLAACSLSMRRDVIANRDKAGFLFAEYMKWGGFPELLLIKTDVEKTKYLQNLVMDVVTRDVAMRYKIQDLPMLHTLIIMLLGCMARPATVNKLRQRLSGMHYNTSGEWISKYIGYFNDAYIIFPVEILSSNSAVRSVNPKKIYCADHALATACDFNLFNNTGIALENMVYVQLRRQGNEIHYYKTSNGYEIDFVTGRAGNLSIYQVCADLSDEETRKRELRAVKEACLELECKSAKIITLRQDECVELDGITVSVVKADDWLMGF
ncbi:MAG: ATP-binding protein [Treponema sp.]|nr:ATP-binding protein [Treponema sp.]